MIRPRPAPTLLLALPLVVLVACGDDVGPPGGSVAPGSTAMPEHHGAALRAAHRLPREILADAEALLILGLDAVAFASAQAGAATTNGRVEQLGPNERAFRFVPGEGSGLTVAWYDPEGRRREAVFDVERLEASGSRGEAALGADHRVAARVRVEGHLDLQLSSSRSGAQVEGSARGWAVASDERVEVELTFSGARRGEVDLTGSSAETALVTTGAIRGPGYAVTVDERFDAETVTVSGEAASSSTSRLAHLVEVEGRRYRFEGVEIRRAFRDGRPSDLDGFWTAEGEVRSDAGAAARYRLSAEVLSSEGQGFVVVELVTPSGAFELERWQKS